MEVTGVRQQLAWRQGVRPPVEEVGPGLWSIPVPIPDNPLRYVLVYAFALPDGVALVDAGWDCDEAWDALVAGLGTAGYRIADVRRLLVTHLHPDHFGLAGRVRAASGALLAMHPADAELVRHVDPAEAAALAAETERQLLAAGAPEPLLGSLEAAGLRRFEPFEGPDILLTDGQRLDLPGWNLEAVWTPGHTPGHLCLYERDRGLLLTGDHVLPRISPNISLLPQQLSDPLGTYLDSLRKVAALDPAEVLPAHEYRFRGLDERVNGLLSHHEERLEEIEKAVSEAPGATAWEVAALLTWSRPLASMAAHLRRFALRETLAHLVLLECRGLLRPAAGVPARWYPVGLEPDRPSAH